MCARQGHGLVSYPATLTVWLLVAPFTPACAGGPPSTGDVHQTASPAPGLSPDERITGRAGGSHTVTILTDRSRLLHYGRDGGEPREAEISGLRHDEQLWGLARLDDGSLWTLVGRRMLARVSPAGRIDRRIELSRPILNVFGWRRGLVFHEATPKAGGSVLTIRNVDELVAETGEVPFGRLRVRDHATRVERLAFSLVLCGSSAGVALPCWFTHALGVDLARPAEQDAIVPLEGLGLQPPRELTIGDLETRGPIRDVYLDAAGALWVLASRVWGDTAISALQVARYTTAGRLTGRIDLDLGARLILGTRGDTCVLLTRTGSVREVRL